MTDIQAPLHGIWPALLTPLTDTLAVDHARFARHARRLLDAGCVGITPFGTTGEGPSFSMPERRDAVQALVDAGVPAARILVSTSCAALPDVVELTRHALAIGAHGCLMLPPFFHKGVSDDGIVDAYRWVIDRVADARLRVYLYDIPQISGVALSHRAIETLKSLYPQTIVGIKDSGCNRAASLALADAFIDRVMIYVGNELDLVELAKRGSTGAVSGIANAMPRLVERLVSGRDDAQRERDLQRVRTLLDIIAGYAMTPAFKGVMALLDGDDGWLRVRPTLRALSSAEFARLTQQMRSFAIDRDRE
jgi:4-hydroxy-tetrahydrodipicolinate synthase